MSQESDRDEMRPEYDFRGGVRGKYFDPARARVRVTIRDMWLIAPGGNAGVQDVERVTFTWAEPYLTIPRLQVGTLTPAA